MYLNQLLKGEARFRLFLVYLTSAPGDSFWKTCGEYFISSTSPFQSYLFLGSLRNLGEDSGGVLKSLS